MSKAARNDKDKWCLGLGYVGTEELSHERRQSMEKLTRSRYRRARILIALIGVVFVVPILWAILAESRGTLTGAGFLAAAVTGLAISLFLVGAIGGVAETLFPQRPITRYLLLGTIVTAVACQIPAVRSIDKQFVDILGAGSAAVWFFLGAPLGLLRWHYDRTFLKARTAIFRDISEGVVDVYRGNRPLVFDSDTAFEPFLKKIDSAAQVQIEVLPVSGVVVRINSQDVKLLRAAKLETTAPVGKGLSVSLDVSVPEGVEARMRYLTEQELEEIKLFHSGMLWKGIGGAIFAAYCFAVVLRGILKWYVDFDPTRYEMLFAILVGAILVFKGIVNWYRVREDIGVGRAVLLDEFDEEAGENVTFEILPNSSRIWSVNGTAADWRKVKL